MMAWRARRGRGGRGPALARPVLMALFAGVTGVLSGCEHPIAVVSAHVEAADLVVTDVTGAELTRTDFNRVWTVPTLTLTDGVPAEIILTALDFRGEPLDISGRSDLSFRMEAENGALLQWEPLNALNRIHPFGTGETRVRFLIWHINHADFVTPWLAIRIEPEATPASPRTSEVP